MALINQDATIRALVQLHEETGVKTAQAIRVVREMPEADALSSEQVTQANDPNTLSALDCVSRQAAIDAIKEHRALYCDNTPDTFSKLSYAEKSRVDELDTAISTLVNLPPAQPDARLKKIADLVDGTIDHFDRDDAMDLLYQIKEVLKDG